MFGAIDNIKGRARLVIRSGRIRNEVRASGYAIRVDQPQGPAEGPFAIVMGVIFTEMGKSVISCSARAGDDQLRVLLHDRPDLIRSIKGSHPTGFSLILPNLGNRTAMKLSIETTDKTHDHDLHVEFTGNPFTDLKSRRDTKRKKLDSVICCPACKADIEASATSCPSCQRPYMQGSFDFRTPQLGELLDSSTRGNISAHQYDVKATSLIERFKDGLVLDNGCGLRKTYYDNVVNFEIEDYPTTDVLGVGEELPFKDASFDAVFSLSVLEHVRDPFKCASEIMRVLKPGGEPFVAVPFLQPFHGYPDHYYNMTSSGLKNLFESQVDIHEVGVSDAGHPFWSLQWFLRNYSHGLSDAESDIFENLQVKDLIEPGDRLRKFLLSNLNERKREELASFNYMLARKKN